MAFFTRVNLNVPVLPPEDSAEITVQHRRHASEPVGGQAASVRTSIHGIREVSAVNSSRTSANNAVHRSSVVGLPSSTNGPETRDSGVCTNAAVTTDSSKQTVVLENPSDKPSDDSGEPKRYEYVVDRVLGVEV